MNPTLARGTARAVAVLGGAAAGASLGGWWWPVAIVGAVAGVVVPEAPRAGVVQAGASLALVAGAVAEDRVALVILVAFVCFASLELHAVASASPRRERSALFVPALIIVGGTVWAGVVAAVAVDVGTGAVPVVAGAALLVLGLVAARPFR